MNDIERKASRANELLNDEVMIEVFDSVEKNAIEAMITAKSDDERREQSDRVRAIRAIRSELGAIITRAKAAGQKKPAVV